MPQGKGTYGSQVGRPSKKGKKKYNIGGNVDPFSTRNPEGVPATQLADAMENQNMATTELAGAIESQNMANTGLPMSNAQERSQMSPDVTSYNEGGKVKKEIYRPWVDAKDKRSKGSRKKKGVKGALERIVPGGKSGYEKKQEKYKPRPVKMRKSSTVDWSKKSGEGQFKDQSGKDVKIKDKKKDKK